MQERTLRIGRSLTPGLAGVGLQRHISRRLSLLVISTALLLARPIYAVVSYPVVPAFGGLTFPSPVQVVFPPGETQRAFVVELAGTVSVINNVAAPTRSVVLDLSARVNQGTPDHGLLSLAFHPKFASNGYIYLWTSIWESGSRYLRLLRFTVAATGIVDPASELTLISQAMGTGGHDGGTLFFGTDGYLYISIGDGDEGSAGAEAIASHQRIDRGFFGGVLRIDVDQAPTNLTPNPHGGQTAAGYRIPADNPFVGATSFNNQPVTPSQVRTEFWAVGLRNPFRMSLDAPTGDIWVGDVGLDTREEIDTLTRGGNFGWNFREGSAPGPLAAQTPAGVSFVAPIWDYTHVAGDICITGGVVYRGNAFPELQGAYIFADYISGRIWSAANSGTRPFAAAQVAAVAAEPGIVAITVQPGTGDILLVNHDEGLIQRLGATVAGATPPTITSQPTSPTVLNGGSLALYIAATGPGLRYQWYFNSAPIAGATSALLYIPGVTGGAAGSYTCEVSNAFGAVVSAPAKVGVAGTADSRRLLAIATRGIVGAGDNIMIAGFVIGGTLAKTVIVRASGPALARFVPAGTLPDPVLQVFDSAGNRVAVNQGWGGSATIASVAASVGLIAWSDAASLDSAVLLTLPPGGYTAQVSGASNDTGVALVEVYDVP